MSLGDGALTFEYVDNWAQLPDGWSFVDVAGVAIDSKDNVYALNRSEHPVMVFDQDGKFLRSFGEGAFSKRTHGIHIAPDESVYCVDDGLHVIRKYTTEGKLLMTMGSENQPSPKWSGIPFNRPTHIAVSPNTGEMYVTDGYGNSRVHKYTPDGRLLFSWGEPGMDPGQFIRPHNVVIDNDDNIYVADREAHRIQIFNTKGKVVAIWNNIHRPDGICLDKDGNFFIGELNGMPGVDDAPGLGHRISIYNLQGQLISRFGDPHEGEGPGQFIAPHGVATDSRGDLYVGEASTTIRGSHMDPPRELRSFQKYARVIT
jgi:DNA-binding beta-propeller fold protein YncE